MSDDFKTPFHKPDKEKKTAGDVPQTAPELAGASPDVSHYFVRSISHSSNFTIGNVTHYHQEARSNLLDKSQVYVGYCGKEDDLFVETMSYKQAKLMLLQNNVVNVLGGSGDGKSALLRHLALDMLKEGFLPLEVSGPEDIEANFCNDRKLFFVCDDPFGGPYVQQISVDAWVKFGISIEKYLETGKVKIAFASRKATWADCEKSVGDITLFRHMVEVSSAKLTLEEKKTMLRRHFEGKLELRESDVAAVAELERPIAFPYCCRLVSNLKTTRVKQDHLLCTFQRPFVFLRKELRKMMENTPWKYSVLVLVMLSGGSLPCSQLIASDADKRTRGMIDCVLDACGIYDARKPFGQLKQCADRLVGSYLKRGVRADEEEVYNFLHDSIFEAVALEYGQDYGRDFLEYSQTEWIVAVCRPQNYEPSDAETVIRVYKRHYKKLAEIFSDEVIVGNSRMVKVFSNPCVQNETFQQIWIESIKSSGKLEAFLQVSPWFGKSLLYYAATGGASHVVKLLLGQGASCASGNHFYHPFVGACRGGHTESISLLLDSSPPDNVFETGMVDACYLGCWEAIKYLFGARMDMCKGVVGKAFIAAAEKGHIHLVSFLLNHGPSCNDIETGFVQVCKSGHLSIVQHLLCVQDQLCTGKVDDSLIGAAGCGQIQVVSCLLEHNPTDKAMEEALFAATRLERVDVLKILLGVERQTGLDLTKPMVNAASVGSMEKITLLMQFSPSTVAVQHTFVKACRSNHIDIVKYFFDIQPDTCKVVIDKAVVAAAEGDSMQVMKFLIDLEPGSEAIHKAVVGATRYGNEEIVQYLFCVKSEIVTDVVGQAFREAARKGQCKIIKFLLEKGADVDAVDGEGQSALQIASKHWRTNVVNLLLAKGASE